MIPDNVHISLIFSRGFDWFSADKIHLKGFLFIPGGEFLEGSKMLEYFSGTSDLDEFEKKVSQANGMFSIVLIREDRIWLACDRMRSFPIFYSLPGDKGIYISDSVDQIINDSEEWNLNRDGSLEFLATGYVTGRETLAQDIWQVQSAEIIEICNEEIMDPTLESRGSAGKKIREKDALRIISHLYSSYLCQESRQIGLPEAEKEFGELLAGTFQRLLDSLGGRTAVIALSGGYDSRLILAMLHNMEYKNLVCYSYGRKGNAETEIAGRVCEKLRTRFIPVVYDEKLIRGYVSDPGFREYVKYSSNMVSMFFLQEYFAVKYLKDRDLVPVDSVFIPGHSGDFFAGSQLIKHGLGKSGESPEKLVRRIIHLKYAWSDPGNKHLKLFRERVIRSLEDKNLVENALSYSIHEDWDLKEKLSKFLVNSCNVYSWFGYQYRLPLYDYGFQDFFRDLPFELKADKKLYDAYLRKNIFEEIQLNFPDELQPGLATQRRARLKSGLKPIIPAGILPSGPAGNDPIFYREITGLLREDLRNRGFEIKIHGKSYNSIIVQWYIQMLGEEF